MMVTTEIVVTDGPFGYYLYNVVFVSVGNRYATAFRFTTNTIIMWKPLTINADIYITLT